MPVALWRSSHRYTSGDDSSEAPEDSLYLCVLDGVVLPAVAADTTPARPTPFFGATTTTTTAAAAAAATAMTTTTAAAAATATITLDAVIFTKQQQPVENTVETDLAAVLPPPVASNTTSTPAASVAVNSSMAEDTGVGTEKDTDVPIGVIVAVVGACLVLVLVLACLVHHAKTRCGGADLAAEHGDLAAPQTMQLFQNPMFTSIGGRAAEARTSCSTAELMGTTGNKVSGAPPHPCEEIHDRNNDCANITDLDAATKKRRTVWDDNRCVSPTCCSVCDQLWCSVVCAVAYCDMRWCSVVWCDVMLFVLCVSWCSYDIFVRQYLQPCDMYHMPGSATLDDPGYHMPGGATMDDAGYHMPDSQDDSFAEPDQGGPGDTTYMNTTNSTLCCARCCVPALLSKL